MEGGAVKAKCVEGLVVAEKLFTSCDVPGSNELVVDITPWLVPHVSVGSARMVLKAVEAVEFAVPVSSIDRVNEVVDPDSLVFDFQADSAVVRDHHGFVQENSLALFKLAIGNHAETQPDRLSLNIYPVSRDL